MVGGKEPGRGGRAELGRIEGMRGRVERKASAFLIGPFVIAALLLTTGAAWGVATDDQTDGTGDSPFFRADAFAGWFHNVGNLLLHVSNRGYFGHQNSDGTNPSAEWPAGSNNEYLYAAGLWVGGVISRGGAQDTLVSAGLYQFGEYYNRNPGEGCGSPPLGICETFEGASSGLRLFDDDGDGSADEDPLDGEDNDGDGRIDEDFAGISQQMFRTVYYDTSIFFNQFKPDLARQHRPLGLEVVQESYVWTDPQFDDFVGIEFRVKNVSETVDQVGWDIRDSYIGFMVDGDVGFDDTDLNYWQDDQGSFIDTTHVDDNSGVTVHVTMGYIYDELGGENAADDVPGYCGVMFLGHSVDTIAPDFESALAPREVGIHAFRIWSGGDQDPRNDFDRYRFLRGDFDTARTIDPPTSRANDYRFLVSAGPFKLIPPGSTLTFQVAFVCGNMMEVVQDEITRRVPDIQNPVNAQRVYDGFFDDISQQVVHWATSSPPPPPDITVTPGDDHVVVEWNDFPENSPDPLTREYDFAGYQVWKAEGWRRESTIPSDEMWRLVADFDSTELSDVDTGRTGIGKYRYVDTRVQNGFWYWYAVAAYDRGTFERQIDAIDSSVVPWDTSYVFTRTEDPKFGKPTQNMVQVMPSPTATQTLDDVIVVPNPYKGSAAWDLAETNFEPTGRRIKFYNLPERATIRIFTLAGDHVITIVHDDNDRRGSDIPVGATAWNLISKNNQDTVSGIYLYHITSEIDGSEKVGKFVVIR
jgi:hypothetical protein